MATEIAITNQLDFDTLQRHALALFESHYYPNAKTKAQAIVKVMAGNELGLTPTASIAGIHIIQGKPVLSSNLIATLIDKHPQYGFRVLTPEGKENERCDIEFFKMGTSVGKISFTMEEAKKAALTSKDTWTKYPSEMLFARAITRGARRLVPGVFGGVPTFTPDELMTEEQIKEAKLTIEDM
jgi:hypothetical protein